jgi:hypothetical protein
VRPFYVNGPDGKTYCTLADKSVALGMIAVGSALQFLASAGINQTAISLSAQLMTQLAWTSRGGPWLAFAGMYGHIAAPYTGGPTGVVATMLLDGTAGSATDGTVVASTTVGSVVSGTGPAYDIVPFGLTVLTNGTGLSAASHRIKVAAQVTGQNLGNIATVDSGYLVVLEFA